MLLRRGTWTPVADSRMAISRECVAEIGPACGAFLLFWLCPQPRGLMWPCGLARAAPRPAQTPPRPLAANPPGGGTRGVLSAPNVSLLLDSGNERRTAGETACCGSARAVDIAGLPVDSNRRGGRAIHSPDSRSTEPRLRREGNLMGEMTPFDLEVVPKARHPQLGEMCGCGGAALVVFLRPGQRDVPWCGGYTADDGRRRHVYDVTLRTGVEDLLPQTRS